MADSEKKGSVWGIDRAIEKAEGYTPPPPPPPPTTQSDRGVDFFNGRPATDAQKKAKQAALLKKLRESGDI